MPKLPTSLEQYRVIFEDSAAAIMFADENKRIVAWNRFAEKLLGMTEEDLQQTHLETIYPRDEWLRIQGLGITERGVQEHLETKMVRSDKTEVDVDISITVLKDDAGKVTGSIGIIRDITERKSTERALLDTYRMKGEFLAMVSHELRTPLTAIKGSVGIVLEGSAGSLNEEQKDFLITAQRNTDRLEILINNVLDYQRLEAGVIDFKFHQDDVNQIVDLVKADMDLLAQKKGLDLRVVKKDNLPKVMLDRERFKRALRNLVDNAIKFTGKGEVVITTGEELSQVSVSVSDTGIGMTQDERAKIFNKFSQVSSGHGRQTGSLGLGLVTARKILSAHQGEIWVESEPAKGSTFTVLLPTKKEGE